MTLSVREKMRETDRAKRFAASLHIADVWALRDQLVLGDLDWRDWFDTKPSGYFLARLDEELIYREDLST